MIDIERAHSALCHLDAGCGRDQWVRIGMAAKAAGISFEYFNNWSASGSNYENEKSCLAVWSSFNASGGITSATLFALAYEQGWTGVSESSGQWVGMSARVGRKVDEPASQALRATVNEVWERCVLAKDDETYIFRKQGQPEGLRIYPESAPQLIIGRKNVAGYLVVPCLSNGKLQTLQFVSPSGGKKLNFPHASFNDGYFVAGDIAGLIYIVEGIGQAWAVNKAGRAASVVCFGLGRMMRVAKVLREKHPNVRLVVVSDRGKEKQAAEIATAVMGEWVEMPRDKPENYDANDYLLEHGETALRDLLSNQVVEMPLSVIFTDELPDDFTPLDEIVEGVLTSGDGSILYGDSNSGKTFFVIDLACALARGVDWFGRKTEQGLVIYLAAESPVSVRGRLQAYQRHYSLRVPNFAIVQSPVDLFDGEADTDALIQTIKMLEMKCGLKARLIVGDTLARLSAGANENAGQDMGLVIRHFDRIRTECEAHFMLIHHSGKNVAAGARGWSGVRAAVDTEIEVTDLVAGRCAEITKQRDLGTKGVRIGFRLETVSLGLTKWNAPATSCVVVPVDAPLKQLNRRLSEVSGAIIEYLDSLDKPIKKSELVIHFKGQYLSSTVYRELKKLVESGRVIDCMGLVNLVLIGAN